MTSQQTALFAVPTPTARHKAGKPAPAPIVARLGKPGPWVLTITAPAMTKTVRNPKTRVKTTKVHPGWLTMNDRMYWRKRADLAKQWKDFTRQLARATGMPTGTVTRARFDAELRFKTGVRRDPINWHPTVKACIDALTAGTVKHPGYGFLPDDSPQYLHCGDCPHLTIGDRLPAEQFGPHGLVVLTITELSTLDGAA